MQPSFRETREPFRTVYEKIIQPGLQPVVHAFAKMLKIFGYYSLGYVVEGVKFEKEGIYQVKMVETEIIVWFLGIYLCVMLTKHL